MPDEERYCQSCKNLVGKRWQSELAESWSCHAKENVVAIGRDLVTGSHTYNLRFTTCYDARSAADEAQGCGSTGAWWEIYQEPEREYPRPKVVGGARHTAEALLEELENLEEKK